jgi:hypothetical protein
MLDCVLNWVRRLQVSDTNLHGVDFFSNESRAFLFDRQFTGLIRPASGSYEACDKGNSKRTCLIDPFV